MQKGDEMKELWIKIDELRIKSFPDFEDPWNSYDEEMRRVWAEITHPKNLETLRTRLELPLNSYALKITRKALRDCLLKIKEL